MDSSHPTITTISSTTTTAIASAPIISLSASRRRVKLSPHLSKQQPHIQWRNPTQAKIYNRRLISSLHNLTINSSSSSSPPARAIKDAADSALAMTACGQTRWSRAILSRRWQMRKVVIVKPKVKKRKKEKEGGGGMVGGKEKEKVKDRLRLLGNLVPGCRKVAMEDLLEETADYVAALELQVKAMKALSDALSSFSSPSSSATFGVLDSSGTPP